MFLRLLHRIVALSLLGWAAVADPTVTVAPATPPADLAATQSRLRVAAGFEVDLWASEPLVQNPTSLSFDGHGRAFVVESFRRRTSVFDIRNFKEWVPDDLALNSVADRAQFLENQLATNRAFLEAATKSPRGFRDFTGDGTISIIDLSVEAERIRLVWDQDRNGQADRAVTFADGFNSPVSGVAAGVLALGSQVWFTCIPDLWRFTVTKPEFARGEIPSAWLTNAANLPPGVEAQRLLTGFGVHVAYGGHDMHGLIKGPDGRIYFTIADRGAAVTNLTSQRPFDDVRHTGAVFRCEPDGSKLEVFARGLRNPQELAFDEFGNLWTGDNNGDGGDKARWTLVLEGADYGWTIGWQWLPKMGAWNSERLWHTRESNTASYLVPPVAHVGHGPAGIAYYPGVGLGDAFAGSFFYCDFPGGVRTFRVEPDGAFFRVVAPEPVTGAAWMEDNSPTNFVGKLLWNLAPVDLAFPPDGGLVVADGFPTWEKDGKGRLWKVRNPKLAQDPAIAEVAKLLASDLTQRSFEELAQLLAHPDFRVRLEAQWTLADRGWVAWKALAAVAQSKAPSRARRHALWGLSQLVRQFKLEDDELVPRLTALLPLLQDSDPTVQGAATRLLGQSWLSVAQTPLTELIKSAPAPVAAQALLAYRDLFGGFLPGGHLRYERSRWNRLREKLPLSVLRLLPGQSVEKGNGVMWPLEHLEGTLNRHPNDPVIQHASTLLLARISEVTGSSIRTQANNHSSSNWVSRLVFLQSERLRADPEVARSLADSHPQLVLESARAIYDVPIPEALPALARILGPTNAPLPFAATNWPTSVNYTRDEWKSFVYRRAIHAARRLGQHDHAFAVARTAGRTDLPESVRVEALDLLGTWGQTVNIDPVVGLHRPMSPANPADAIAALDGLWPALLSEPRTNLVFAALRAGQQLQSDQWPVQLSAFKAHPDSSVRAEAERLGSSAILVPVATLAIQATAGETAERQSALRQLGRSPDPAAVPVVQQWLDQLNRGKVPAELQLEVVEASRALAPTSPALQVGLKSWTNSWTTGDELAPYRVALAGGDPRAGRRLFAERADWGCQRCHRLGADGGEVGPNLTGLGPSKGAEYLLRAIINPNAEIAPGYENLVVTRKDGTTVVGVVKADGPQGVVLETIEDGRITIPAAQIESRDRGLSAMPEGLGELMTLRELRDLLAALVEP